VRRPARGLVSPDFLEQELARLVGRAVGVAQAALAERCDRVGLRRERESVSDLGAALALEAAAFGDRRFTIFVRHRGFSWCG